MCLTYLEVLLIVCKMFAIIQSVDKIIWWQQ